MAVVEREREVARELESPAWTATLHDLVTTVDHKKIGILYVVMAVVFLVIGGCEALLIRWQLFWPRAQFIRPDTFNGLFTMHGTTMVFFVGMPILSGIGTTTAGINFIATILGMRARGMALRKVPFFTWTMLWTSVQILVALPPLTVILVMVLLDRNLGAHFFDTQNGGSAYLWQHLFWFFGHPEVYILILPVFGMVSEIVPVFSRKVLFGYEFMAAATAAIAFISLGVWAHHMFAVGMSRTADLFFVVSSLLVSIPTGIKFFNWLATLYGGRISFASPMLFCMGFLSMFLIGGLTGIMLSAAPFNFQLTDSYFVIGHFHFVLIGGTLFGVFAGIHYWYPKVTGRMLSERLARWQFWLLYVGFLLTFGTMHISGVLGMPRRIYTYDADRGWALLNQLTTLGAIIQVPSFAIFVYNVFASLRNGRPAGDDPWDAWTLEWSTMSPPPV